MHQSCLGYYSHLTVETDKPSCVQWQIRQFAACSATILTKIWHMENVRKVTMRGYPYRSVLSTQYVLIRSLSLDEKQPPFVLAIHHVFVSCFFIGTFTDFWEPLGHTLVRTALHPIVTVHLFACDLLGITSINKLQHRGYTCMDWALHWNHELKFWCLWVPFMHGPYLKQSQLPVHIKFVLPLSSLLSMIHSSTNQNKLSCVLLH